MSTEIIYCGVFVLGVAAGFALAAWLGVVQLRQRRNGDKLEFDERMKS